MGVTTFGNELTFDDDEARKLADDWASRLFQMVPKGKEEFLLCRELPKALALLPMFNWTLGVTRDRRGSDAITKHVVPLDTREMNAFLVALAPDGVLYLPQFSGSPAPVAVRVIAGAAVFGDGEAEFRILHAHDHGASIVYHDRHGQGAHRLSVRADDFALFLVVCPNFGWTSRRK